MKNKYQIATLATLLVLGAGLAFVFQNCGAPMDLEDPPGGVAVKAKSDELSQLAASIKTLSAKDLSCGSDDDCQAVAFGTKGCGGPAEYILVSRLNPDLNQILQQVEQFNTESAALNQQSGLVSDCRWMEPPVYHCVNARCQ